VQETAQSSGGGGAEQHADSKPRHDGGGPRQAKIGGSRTQFEEEHRFIRDPRNAILAELHKGTGFMEIPKAARFPKYTCWVGYEAWREMNTLRLMTDLWMGPVPWIPDAK
jgi:hypothetical protein